jgi:hypothetical protein
VRAWFDGLAAALARVMQRCAHVSESVLGYFEASPYSLFQNLSDLTSDALPADASFYQLTATAHSLLSMHPDFFKSKWDWAPFFLLLASPHAVRARHVTLSDTTRRSRHTMRCVYTHHLSHTPRPSLRTRASSVHPPWPCC